MKIPIYQIDAFTRRVFQGNPAAVCPLESWLPDPMLQSIAAENNLSETAFLVDQGDHYEIRWFTPVTEVDLCGHATLAASHHVFDRHPQQDRITFSSKSGRFWVTRKGDMICLDFASREPTPCSSLRELAEALGHEPAEALDSLDFHLAVYDNEDQVRALRPDMRRLEALDRSGVIVTAPGRSSDFVSRCFVPREGIPEDPVTGSAHCALVPYWAKRLGKTALYARQISTRGGELFCEHKGDRVLVAGYAVSFLEGTIEVPDTR
jgi:PhzF family phenazine biosynthesis protein